ncbi:type II toxin-antitoxin system RelE/ParE family toxin [Allomuricauda sp. SCSIO 65647]|uniref:type II toxin-antitoxin system RelE/ParE family toxin n=1 Tax=Allomuricauda sp. SCSIO 65647 TaxID=2908843 RepID=UPI001F4045B5|nr:type II toxin-antitoxin system RelE/ParE family toxin [Muricauda sp. SCSIO 65647]UJH68645.1 type II toxin-antitoxin system RelE/ParE family toxin [Muricauda sp. SCSIO 65647]
MGFKVQMLKEAAVELHVAECYFASKGLSRAFLNDFARQLQFLKTTPHSFQVKYRGIRILNFEQFNYSIHYKVDKKEAVIYRILNQRQNF